MIAVNDSFWLNSLAYVLLIAKFRDHGCFTDLIDLFHLVRVPMMHILHYNANM